MSWSKSKSRVRLAPLNRFKPSSKIFYWQLLLWIFCVFVLSCVCYVFVRVCLYVLCGHLLGKGWPLGSRLWCLTVSSSLSHWYPGPGVVLDCIDSWSLHPYLLYTLIKHSVTKFPVISSIQYTLAFITSFFEGMFSQSRTFYENNMILRYQIRPKVVWKVHGLMDTIP